MRVEKTAKSDIVRGMYELIRSRTHMGYVINLTRCILVSLQSDAINISIFDKNQIKYNIFDTNTELDKFFADFKLINSLT